MLHTTTPELSHEGRVNDYRSLSAAGLHSYWANMTSEHFGLLSI